MTSLALEGLGALLKLAWRAAAAGAVVKTGLVARKQFQAPADGAPSPARAALDSALLELTQPGEMAARRLREKAEAEKAAEDAERDARVAESREKAAEEE